MLQEIDGQRVEDLGDEVFEHLFLWAVFCETVTGQGLCMTLLAL